MGVREALWLIGLALVCYSVWQFFRALRAPSSSAAVPPAVAQGAQAEAPRPTGRRTALAGGPDTQPTGRGVEAEAPSEVEDEDSFDDYAPLPGPRLGPDPARAQGPSERLPAQPGVVQPDVFQMELDNSRLRQALPDVDRFLDTSTYALRWRLDSPFSLDVADFEASAQAALRDASKPDRALLFQAAGLYRGDFLAGLSLPEGRRFEEWVMLERERLRRLQTG